jgi:hypothetical protein
MASGRVSRSDTSPSRSIVKRNAFTSGSLVGVSVIIPHIVPRMSCPVALAPDGFGSSARRHVIAGIDAGLSTRAKGFYVRSRVGWSALFCDFLIPSYAACPSHKRLWSQAVGKMENFHAE